MEYLMRMISPMKVWTQSPSDISSESDISADAISDLSAQDNAISTWSVGTNTPDEKRKGIIALVSAFRALEDIKVVYINKDELIDKGFVLEQTEGDTKIEEYKRLHYDIAQLNAGKLQTLADIVLQNIWNDHVEVIHKDDLAKWLLSALNDNLLAFDSLEKNFKQGLAIRIRKLVNARVIQKEKINGDVLEAINSQLRLSGKSTNCQFEHECGHYRQRNIKTI